MTAIRPDPRLHPYRDDLAAAHLRGQVVAARFVDGETRQVVASCAPLRRGPGHVFALDSELLSGEKVCVYEDRDGWAWCQSDRDHYVGYVPSSALGKKGRKATHSVTAVCSHVYIKPDIKSLPIAPLKMNARVSVTRVEERFAVLAEHDSYVFADHLGPLGGIKGDFVAVAEKFLGAPYLWGGRTNAGLDCSALVQLALHATGRDCPRDSDMQAEFIGDPLDSKSGLEDLRRGDLIFWNGHVGIMTSAETLLHATAHYMMVVAEPVRDAVDRIERAGSGTITAVRRLA